MRCLSVCDEHSAQPKGQGYVCLTVYSIIIFGLTSIPDAMPPQRMRLLSVRMSGLNGFLCWLPKTGDGYGARFL